LADGAANPRFASETQDTATMSVAERPQGAEQPAAPRLAEKEPKDADATPRAAEVDNPLDPQKKNKKRSLFGFGKKGVDEKPAQPSSQSKLEPSPAIPVTRVIDAPTRTSNTSPVQQDIYHPMLPSSPGRALSTSPRLHSPAGSQIFERDVQESAVMPNSPAIPSHINTENYIPPVLDASSEAITDNHLDPDSVEIITSVSHQPAAVAVNVTGAGPTDMASSWAEELDRFGAGSDPHKVDDSASNYGSLDTTDVRRLSFISFADVVQAEHPSHGGLAGSRDSMHLGGLTSLASMGGHRSPSPIRSPVSSQPGTSPPTSQPGSVKGLELSPTRKPLASPGAPPAGLALHPGTSGTNVTGDLQIETMSQALRRTGSGDLSGVRSLPTSPIEGPSR
jgi:hypothetical protein